MAAHCRGLMLDIFKVGRYFLTANTVEKCCLAHGPSLAAAVGQLLAQLHRAALHRVIGLAAADALRSVCKIARKLFCLLC